MKYCKTAAFKVPTHKTTLVIRPPGYALPPGQLSLSLNSFNYGVLKLFDQKSYSSFSNGFFYSGYKPSQI